MKSTSILAAIMVVCAGCMKQTDLPKPPVADMITTVDTVHGDVRVDDYFWLREKSNPKVSAYLEAENAYTREVMKPTTRLQETIYEEILKRTKQTDLSVPYRLGEYWYYSRTEEGKQYPILCRKKGTIEAAEQVTIDVNEIGKEHAFAAIGLYEVSDDGNLLAYSVDTTGFREYDLYVKDLRTNELLPDRFGKVTMATWAADNRTLFLVREDRAKRPYRLTKRLLGNEHEVVLFEEQDELYRIMVNRSRDRKYVFLTSASSTTTEVRYLRADKPSSALAVVLPREEHHEYYVDHRDGLFYLRTNKDAKNFRIVTVPVASAATNNWKEFRTYRAVVKIEDFDLFAGHAVFSEMEGGLMHLRVHTFATGKETEISFPEPVYAVFAAGNPEYATTVFRYNYQSFVTPSSVYDYEMTTGKQTLLKRTDVLGGYEPAQYESARVMAKASDGTAIPVSIVYRKGMARDGKNPLLLYGYGSYGASIPVAFSVARLSLLDRGVMYALAHVRGGGDMGEEWHDMGKMMTKRNTFTDFIACAEYLVAERYTSPEYLAIQGGSAGGLLIGAVLNMRPDLFKAAHMAVPFVDVINTMLDESLPLTVGEFLEWGNPKKKDEYEYIKTYCPYTNLGRKAYPNILITTSFNDSQVMYWEPAKYVAKLRTLKTDKNMLLLKTNMGAGHGGASGRYDAFREQAFNYAFLLYALGIDR